MKSYLKPNSPSIILLVLAVVGSFNACKKDDPPNPPKGETGIYATYTSGGQHRNRKASLWKDDLETDITTYITEPNSTTSSKLYIGGMAVSSSGDVYVSGCECTAGLNIYNQLNGGCYTVLWKNGVKQNLNSTPGSLWFLDASDNYLSLNEQGDVFVLGMTGEFSNYTVWKNGTILLDLTDATSINDMFVRGNDVYTTGDTSSNNGKYVLWKNSSAQALNANGSRPQTIFVSNSNEVFVALNNGKLLKNNAEQTLEPPAGLQVKEISDITGHNSDLYVLGSAGVNFGEKTIIWKNGTPLYELTYSQPGAYLSANQLFVLGNDVYAYGTVGYGTKAAAVLWKNGLEHKTIYEGDNVSGVVDARAFFVK